MGFFSDIVQKGGGVQMESKSFEVVLFSLILTFFWTLNGGVTMFQKIRGTFCLNIGYIFQFKAYTKVTSQLSKMGQYKSDLTDVQNEGGGVKATFGQCPKERRIFFLRLPLAKKLLRFKRK